MSSETEPHHTTLSQKLEDGITRNTHNKHQHENVTHAIGKDIHQDHHRTTEQPVYDKEVLPETHEQRVHQTEERVFDNRDKEGLQNTLNEARGGYQDERVVAPTQHTQSQAPDDVSEHVHHHVHETVQPVVYKETVQPHTVHTTKPIHETHHMKATHEHGSALPAMSMDEFKNKAGNVTGRGENLVDDKEGCPQEVLNGRNDGIVSSAAPGNTANNRDYAADDTTTGNIDGNSTSSMGKTSTGPHKSSLLNKLDPRVDANGDGKAGFMK